MKMFRKETHAEMLDRKLEEAKIGLVMAEEAKEHWVGVVWTLKVRIRRLELCKENEK